MSKELIQYGELLTQIKNRIRQAQVKAAFLVNARMIQLYWDIGKIITEEQKKAGWGSSVIPKLSRDIRNELPEVKGFSERNIGRMISFYRAYPEIDSFLPQAVAKIETQSSAYSASSNKKEKVPQAVAESGNTKTQSNLQQLVAQIPWGHNILLMEKIKDIPTRFWYMQQTIENSWSRNVLSLMIKSKAHIRQGKAVTNFEKHLPSPQSDLAKQTLKDRYIFDFLTLEFLTFA